MVLCYFSAYIEPQDIRGAAASEIYISFRFPTIFSDNQLKAPSRIGLLIPYLFIIMAGSSLYIVATLLSITPEVIYNTKQLDVYPSVCPFEA